MTRPSKLDPDTEDKLCLARVAGMQKMAQALLDDPETGAAFRRVGVSGDFTPEEHAAIYDRFGLGRYYAEQNMIVAADYQAVIQALARRVAAGVYASVHDDEALDYAVANTFIEGNYERIRDQRIALEDYLIVLREYMAWDKLREHLNAFKTWEFDHNSDLSESEQLSELSAPLYEKSWEIFRKYGHVGRFEVSSVASELIRNGETVDDLDAVRRHATSYRSSTRIKGITESSDKWVTKRLIDEVRQMVAEHSGTGFEKIGEHSDLSNDVGFEGVDAEAFMLAYSKKFGVDLSYFWYPDYFHQEHQLSNPLSWLFKYLGRDLPKKPLTIMMLAQAAAVGKWPARDTEISSS